MDKKIEIKEKEEKLKNEKPLDLWVLEATFLDDIDNIEDFFDSLELNEAELNYVREQLLKLRFSQKVMEMYKNYKGKLSKDKKFRDIYNYYHKHYLADQLHNMFDKYDLGNEAVIFYSQASELEGYNPNFIYKTTIDLYNIFTAKVIAGREFDKRKLIETTQLTSIQELDYKSDYEYDLMQEALLKSGNELLYVTLYGKHHIHSTNLVHKMEGKYQDLRSLIETRNDELNLISIKDDALDSKILYKEYLTFGEVALYYNIMNVRDVKEHFNLINQANQTNDEKYCRDLAEFYYRFTKTLEAAILFPEQIDIRQDLQVLLKSKIYKNFMKNYSIKLN